jgi:transcriptional regulator with XRE-family HTH domain
MVNKTPIPEKKYSGLNRRLLELMRNKNMTIQALSKEAGVAVGTIQKLISDPSCNPTIASIEAVCNVLDVSVSEIIGQEERLNTLNSSSVFLLDWEELPITLLNIQSLSEKGNKEREIIKTPCPVSKNSFALRMSDNSMLPLFPQHTILIFDHEKTPKDDNYVLVQMHNYQNVIFKQLVIDEPFKYLVSINPLFKDSVIKLEAGDKIFAVLIQSQMHY